MDKISELKEIIFNLKMEVVKTRVYKGSCPYSRYPLPLSTDYDCSMGCEECRNIFLRNMEEKIRKEVEEL